MNSIAVYRKKLGITQTLLAEKLGWNQSRIANYETGKRLPNLNVCYDIVSFFNSRGLECTVDSLFPPVQQRESSPSTGLPAPADKDDDEEGDIDLTEYYNV